MAGYKIYFTDVALKNLKRFPAKDRAIIIEKIKTLAENPLAKTNIVKLVEYDILPDARRKIQRPVRA